MDANVSALIAIAIGLALCLFGFKIQKSVIAIAWFGIGFTLADKIGSNFIEAANILLIVKIVAGILLASVGFKLEKLAIAIAVGYLTYTSIGAYITGFEESLKLIIHIGISIGAGILSMLFIKPILICITSIAGATIVKEYLITFITLEPSVLMIGTIVLAVVGIIIQLKTT